MPFSDNDLRRRLAGQQWTSHNIRLSPEVTTMPGQPDLIETDLRLHAIFRALSLFYRDNLSGLRAADLGCLEGGFSLALAQRGMNVVGIEARYKNLEKTELLHQHFGLSNLEFLRDDVKNFTAGRYGTFDVVLALGILYHLDRPVEWLRQVSEATEAILIIDSHYAPSDEAGIARLDPRIAQLGPLRRIDDNGTAFHGREFFEFGPEADREAQLWASYSNGSSFWLTKESLLRSVMRAGFDLVLEQHDYSADWYDYFTASFPRIMLVAIKSGGLGKSSGLASHR
jgi:hypothetical protein